MSHPFRLHAFIASGRWRTGLIACALLGAQWFAAIHGLSHIVVPAPHPADAVAHDPAAGSAPPHPHPSEPSHDAACALCLALHAVGAGAAGNARAAAVTAKPSGPVASPPAVAAIVARARSAHRARAPPRHIG